MSKKKNTGAVSVEFAVPAFRHKGKEYKSAEVEKAASEGDEEAQELIAHLVSINSGVVKVIEQLIDEDPAPKAPKAPKAKKGEEGVDKDE